MTPEGTSGGRRRAPGALAFLFLLLAGAALLPGCGREVLRGAKARPRGPQISKRLDPTDLFPTDLDLVMRVDVARLRAGLGPSAVDQLRARAFGPAAEDTLAAVLGCAEVVWIATRLADLDNGDRVVVVEGPGCTPVVSGPRWQARAQTNDDVAVFDRKGEVSRAGTARVITLGTRAAAFVSPVELDSVERVLRGGPDERRGDPAAEGVVSVDLLARRLPPALERRFPSIGAVIGGLDRVRGSAVLVDEGVRIEAEIRSPTQVGADRARRFLEAVRESALSSRYAAVVKGMTLDPVGTSVRLRWVVPAKVVLALLAGDPDPPDRPAPPAAPPP